MTTSQNPAYPATYCRCGVLLSANGQTWGPKQGYRVSRRSIDGTPILGVVGDPLVKGVRPMCRQCAEAAVAARRSVR